METHKVGVIGAGTIGLSLAIDLAAHAYDVVVIDNAPTVIAGARDKVVSDLRMYRILVEAYRDIEDDAILKRMVFTEDLSALSDADFIIENITEDLAQKLALFDRLAAIGRPDACYATNTSCISVTKLGSRISDPSRMIGMHFMNPVPVRKFVEMIRGERTSEDTIACARALVKRLGKNHVLVNDFPGFVSNRVMMLTVNECAFVVQDGVADAAQVDKVFRQAFGHETGPLATADLIGLDTVLNSIVVLYEEYKDSKYRPCPLLQKMVDAGYLGRKSGRGFFKYTV